MTRWPNGVHAADTRVPPSVLPTLGLDFLNNGSVAGIAQHPAQVDNHLGVDVLMRGDVEDSVSDPTVTATIPSWCSTTEPIASSKETTACHSMLWLTGCWKIWRSVLR
jgi:hypothetical protein